MKEMVLQAIAQASEEESKLYMQAAIRRREFFLDGGEVLYSEFSRELVQHRDELNQLALEVERKWEERKRKRNS